MKWTCPIQTWFAMYIGLPVFALVSREGIYQYERIIKLLS